MGRVVNMLEYRALSAQPRHICGRDCPGEYEPEHHCLSNQDVSPPKDYAESRPAPSSSMPQHGGESRPEHAPRLPRSRRTYFVVLCVGIAVVWFALGWAVRGLVD